MAITKLNFAPYTAMTSSSSLPASTWNTMWQATETAVNALIDAVGDTPAVEEKFYVNGTLTAPVNGKVTLDAFGGTNYPTGGYKLSGVLTGQIVIGASTDEPTDDTEIILDGVTVKTASDDNAAIMYMPNSQTLRITLAKNVLNTVVCSNVATMADSQKGCIWSEKNLVIQGNGYLALQNLGGHGIKASELRFYGNPHIYAHAVHDAFHGNSEVDLCGGTFYVAKANDAFGTKAGESGVSTQTTEGGFTGGIIEAFQAYIMAYNVSQNVFDSKGSGHIYTDNVTIETDCSATNIMSGMTKIDPKIFFGLATFDATTGTYTTEPSGWVKCYSDEDCTQDETTITPSGSVYTLTTKYCKVGGYIDGTINTSIQSTDIHFEDNTYITGDIKYLATKKKLGLYVAKDGVVCMVTAVSSSSNLAIEVKSGSFFYSPNDIISGDITITDTKGVIMVDGLVGCKILYVGTAETPDTTKKLWGAFIVNGKVEVVLNSKRAKGNVVVDKAGLVGVFCTPIISVASTSNLGGSDRVFYNEAKGIVIGAKTIEDADYKTV